VCDLETSRMGAPYIYDISHLRVKEFYDAVPHANSLDGITLRASMISFLDNKKKRESHAEYCKTCNKKRKLNSNTRIVLLF